MTLETNLSPHMPVDGAVPDSPTPRMDEAELREAGQLSLQSMRPPIRVPGYEQEQFLGRGAYGEVWKAVDSNSGRAVAIKFYSRRGELDWSHMAREVEKLQHLFSDRYVVQLFGVGWQSDPPYYVMEYMPYGSLEDRIRRGSLTTSDAVRIIRETAQGLVHAHDKGILHCDLKPSNIMLDQDDRPRLADFGQARLKHDRAPSLGTLFYMAPEQADLAATPDARWDVYALGVILYRMVTGKLPYLTDDVSGSLSSQGPIEQRLKRYRDLLHQAPPPTLHAGTPGVDRALVEIIDRCLAVDPKRRYRNVQLVLTALEARQTRRSQRSLLLLGLLGPALVVAVMGVVAGLAFHKTMQETERQLVDRTLESDQFAAQTVAAHFSLGLDKRRRMLEQDAAYPNLRRWLSDDALAADEALKADVTNWLVRQHTARNREFTTETTAGYWFIIDAKGKLRAISPGNDALLGNYFGYREYFHGLGKELSPDAPVPPPIRKWHRSNVFRSLPTNQPAVAFSTPVFADDTQREIVGILAMETALGHFSEFQGSRNQFAVLVDLRPDAAGIPGLVVEHPYFEKYGSGDRPSEAFYSPPALVERFRTIRDEKLARLTSPETAARENLDLTTFHDYQDPVGADYAGDWLAAVEPIFIARGSESPEDSGWAIVLQERSANTLDPLGEIRRLVRRAGWLALVLVAIVLAALWAVVVLVINPPRRLRKSRFFHGSTGTTATSGGSLSASASESASNDPARPLEPGKQNHV